MRLIDADILLKEGWVLHKMVGTTFYEMPLNHPDVPTVDVDRLNTAHEDIGYEKGFHDGYAEALDVTVDAEPIRHGRWLWVDGVRCSLCNHKLQTTGLPSYCPNCGAKMDGVSE